MLPGCCCTLLPNMFRLRNSSSKMGVPIGHICRTACPRIEWSRLGMILVKLKYLRTGFGPEGAATFTPFHPPPLHRPRLHSRGQEAVLVVADRQRAESVSGGEEGRRGLAAKRFSCHPRTPRAKQPRTKGLTLDTAFLPNRTQAWHMGLGKV